MNKVEDFLLNQIGEINLVQPILTWSAPCLNDIIKKDISSFSSTWKILMHVYVPIAIESLNTRLNFGVILANKEDMLWIVYRELLKEIETFIQIYENVGINLGFGSKHHFSSCLNGSLDCRVYWYYCTSSSWWYQNESFQMLINTLNTQQLLNVIKKFVLRFSHTHRMLLLNHVGLLG